MPVERVNKILRPSETPASLAHLRDNVPESPNGKESGSFLIEKTCCFTGNRNIADNEVDAIKAWLDREALRLAGRGIISFWAGGAIGFDTLAAKAVLRLKAKMPDVQLGLALPCKNMHERWSESDRQTLLDCINLADRTIYMSEEYFAGCMHLRNRFLVDNSSACLYYSVCNGGGTAYTVGYAKKQGLQMISYHDENNNEIEGQMGLLLSSE